MKARKLIVFGIGDTEEQAFGNYFNKFGEVEDFNVLKDPVNMQPKGFGFVVYKTVEAVGACMAE